VRDSRGREGDRGIYIYREKGEREEGRTSFSHPAAILGAADGRRETR